MKNEFVDVDPRKTILTSSKPKAGSINFAAAVKTFQPSVPGYEPISNGVYLGC